MRGQPRRQAGNGGRRIVDLRVQERRRSPIEGYLSAQHLIRHNPQRIEITAVIYRQPLNLFRRHVRRRSQYRAARGEPRGRARPLQGLRDAEICNHDPVVFREQDIRRFDIAVQKAPFVCIIQCLRYLPQNPNRPLQRQGALIKDHLLQRLALNIFHGDENVAFLLAHLVNGHDVRVAQVGSHDRLLLKALNEL
ncbi:MAG: hypothetical protein BWY25_02630 [Chloroflexi bacterium ADurb.Bin222]|nr:MAG: hypothetical protein BWY25_02630 [Chloroflexi bacterium ADurb.Bin222]